MSVLQYRVVLSRLAEDKAGVVRRGSARLVIAGPDMGPPVYWMEWGTARVIALEASSLAVRVGRYRSLGETVPHEFALLAGASWPPMSGLGGDFNRSGRSAGWKIAFYIVEYSHYLISIYQIVLRRL